MDMPGNARGHKKSQRPIKERVRFGCRARRIFQVVAIERSVDVGLRGEEAFVDFVFRWWRARRIWVLLSVARTSRMDCSAW